MPPARTEAALLTTLLAALAATAPSRAAPGPGCQQDGDRITVTGRLSVGHVTPSDDPAKRPQTYLRIDFDPLPCVIEPDAPDGEPVAHAEFLTERPPSKSELGTLQTFTGSLERSSDGTGEAFSLVMY